MTAALKDKMPNKFIYKLILGIMAFVVMIPERVAAQFYDSDREVRIYVLDYVIDNPGKKVVAFVMNFNGSKGAIIATTGSSGISTPSGNACAPGKSRNGIMGILNDDSYFEKLIYNSPDIITYNSEKSTYSKVCYSKIRYAPNLSNPFVQDSFTENYFFSSDGNRVVELSGSNWKGKSWNHTYTRVSKDKLVELILANKNKGSERWR